MIVKKDNLTAEIEEIISQGIYTGEEVDITTRKIIEIVWPLIDYSIRKQL